MRRYRPNPHLVLYNPPPSRGIYVPSRGRLRGNVVGQIAENVHAILYEHAEDGAFYEHEFEHGAQAFALSNGGIWLIRRDGKPLWGEF